MAYVIDIPGDPGQHTVDTDANVLHKADCALVPRFGFPVAGADLDHEVDAHFIAWHQHPSGRLFHLNPCATCLPDLGYDELIVLPAGPLAD